MSCTLTVLTWSIELHRMKCHNHVISDSLAVVSLTMSQYRKPPTSLRLHLQAADFVALPLDVHLRMEWTILMRKKLETVNDLGRSVVSVVVFWCSKDVSNWLRTNDHDHIQTFSSEGFLKCSVFGRNNYSSWMKYFHWIKCLWAKQLWHGTIDWSIGWWQFSFSYRFNDKRKSNSSKNCANLSIAISILWDFLPLPPFPSGLRTNIPCPIQQHSTTQQHQRQ